MKPGRYKTVMITAPQAIVDNAAFGTAILDTKGFGHVEIFFLIGALDIALSVAKVMESDDSGMSGETAVPGCTMGTDANDTGSTSTLPSATDDNKFYKFEIDMKGRKRYLDLNVTMGDGSTGGFVTAWAHLHEADEPPITASEKGVAQLMRAA